MPCQAQQAGWTSKDKLALTDYFYWYNVHTGANFKNAFGADLITLHPPDSYLPTYAWTDVAFHQHELTDMAAAGIDVALGVYWGDPDSVSTWSVVGLQAMVQAEQALAQAGQAAPKIGMFHDISSLGVKNGGVAPDLTTAAGKSSFYSDIHNFFTIVPKQFWATIDGRPILVLYTSNFVSGYDQSTFDYVAQQFQQDFGMTPYVIRHVGWYGVKTDASYAGWYVGFGPTFQSDVASVTPGLDNLNVQQEPQEQGVQIVDRNCGDYYQRNWNQVVSRGARLVIVETWNELFEGSGISATKEYGRQFIDLTAKNVGRWKGSASPVATVPQSVWMSPGPQRTESGLTVALNYPDGQWRNTRIAGREAMYSVDNPGSSTRSYYIYLAVDDRFMTTSPAGVWVTVEYLDMGKAPWWLDYDGASNPYTQTARVIIQNSGQWKTQTFYLPDAIFQRRVAKGVADLRIDDYNPLGIRHYFGRVWITKTAPSGQPPLVPLMPDIVVPPGSAADVAMSALDSAGQQLPLTLNLAPAFSALQGVAGTQSLHFSPSSSDVRTCAEVVTPGVASSPAYPVTAVVNDPNSQLSTGATTFQVSVSSSPTLMLSAPALTFTTTAGSSTPATGVLALRNSAGAAFQATASVTTESGGNWLQWSAGAAGAAGTINLQIAANPAGLASGAYLGAVTISAPGLSQPSQVVPVTLVVTVPASLTVSIPSLSFTAIVGADPAVQSLAISNSGPSASVLNWSASASTVSGGTWLTVTPASGTDASSAQVAVHAASLAAGSYTGAITITSAGAQGSPLTIAVTLTVRPTPSLVSITGVVNGASFLPTIAAASWITIQGSQLSLTTRPWSGADFAGNTLPTQLDGVSVTVNGLPAFVYFISPTQLNVLSPDNLPAGPVQVQVKNSVGLSDTFTVPVAAFAPGLFLFTAKYPAAVHLNGVYVGTAGLIPGVPLSPAIPGETIELFGTGFGPTNPPSLAGTILAAPASLVNSVTATIGGLTAPVSFAGLTSNGLVQLNVKLPSGVPTGDATLIVKVNGAAAQSNLFLTVQSPAPQVIQGTLDVVASSTCSIAGWARDPQNTAPLQVRVYSDGDSTSGTFLGSFTANQLRSDLPFSDQNHGFSQSFASNPLLADGKSHSILVFGVTASGATGPLSGNGKVIQCSPK